MSSALKLKIERDKWCKFFDIKNGKISNFSGTQFFNLENYSRYFLKVDISDMLKS